MAEACGNETVLDLRGLDCPEPVLKASTAMRSLQPGDLLVLECTDPLTMIDIPHFVSQNRHQLIAQERQGEIFVYRILKQ